VPLDSEISAYLEEQKSQPPRSALTLEQTRTRMVESARRYGGDPPELVRIQNNGRYREYHPTSDPAAPTLLYFHGGRFISGNLESHDIVCRRLALASGSRVVAVDYRLAPEHPFPAALEDALAAVDQYKPTGVAGDSAGANLAAVAAAERRQSVVCQVLIYPMIDATRGLASHQEFATGWGPSSDDMRRGWEEYIPHGADPRDPRISPLFASDLENLPRAYVLTAEYDCLRDEGEQYADALARAGNRVEVTRRLGAIHGFIPLTGICGLARQTIDEIGGYLRRANF